MMRLNNNIFLISQLFYILSSIFYLLYSIFSLLMYFPTVSESASSCLHTRECGLTAKPRANAGLTLDPAFPLLPPSLTLLPVSRRPSNHRSTVC
jgi:hypothetical protein